MMTIEIATARRMKAILNKNRREIKSINGVECTPAYPIFEATNNVVRYYDVDKQGTVLLAAPFVIQF